MFRSRAVRLGVAIFLVVSLVGPSLARSTAYASSKVTIAALSSSLNEGGSQLYEVKLTQPIICPALPDGEVCEVILSFSSSDPTRISFSVPQVHYLSNEWSQPRYVTVSTTRDYIYTPNLVQTIKATASGAAPFFTGSISTTNLTLNNLDDPAITGSSEFTGNRDDVIAINDLHLAGDGTSAVDLNIHVPSGSLSLSNTVGLIFNGATAGKNLNFSGTRNDVNAALSSLTFTPSITADVVLQVTIDGLANSVYNPLNRHLYQVGAIGTYPTWNEANAAAQGSIFQNTSGYLATITNQQEQETIFTLKVGGWIGGSDSTAEGDWKWQGGPESGDPFWSGDASGTAVSSSYANWTNGMPDNYTGSNPAGENCLQYYQHDGKWNDQNCDAQQSPDFIVEYGNDTDPISLNYKDVAIHVTQGRDLNDDGTEDADQPNVADLQNLDGKWISIETNSFFGCTLSNTSVVSEASLSSQDVPYDYTGGLVNFTGTCQTPTSDTDVQIFYYDTTLDGTTLRKYDPNTLTFATLPDAILEQMVIDGHDVVVATYHMSDGSVLDTDGDPSNGQWSDPIGLAAAAPIAPTISTDEPAPTSQNLSKSGENIAPIALVGLGLLAATSVLMLNRKKTKK